MGKKSSRNRYPLGTRHQGLKKKREPVLSAFLSDTKTFFQEARVEMLGNRELFIEGACKVVEYDEGVIRVNTRKGDLLITGAELTIVGYGPSVMTIKGKLGGISWL